MLLKLQSLSHKTGRQAQGTQSGTAPPGRLSSPYLTKCWDMLPKCGQRGHAYAQGWAYVAHSIPGLPPRTPGQRPEKWATRVGNAEKVGV